MAEKDELEKALREVWNSVKASTSVVGASDTAMVKGTALLGLAVIRLDKTSGRLAWVNISLTVIIVFATLVQTYLLLRGH